ncbi:hypothetical protein LXL04_009303 [Taraxacum kok-saghyz]
MSNFDVFSDQEEEEKKETKTGIDLGISLEKLSLGPKKKLLVIPLGGFIVHHYGRFKCESQSLATINPFWYQGIISILVDNMCTFILYTVTKMPFCDEFLKFSFARFEVGLWSSGNIEEFKFYIHSLDSSFLLDSIIQFHLSYF